MKSIYAKIVPLSIFVVLLQCTYCVKCYSTVYTPEMSQNDNYIVDDVYHGNVRYVLKDVFVGKNGIVINFDVTNNWQDRESVIIIGKLQIHDDNSSNKSQFERPYINRPLWNKRCDVRKIYCKDPIINGELAHYLTEFRKESYGGDKTLKYVLSPNITVSAYIEFPVCLTDDTVFNVVIPEINGWGRKVIFKELRRGNNNKILDDIGDDSYIQAPVWSPLTKPVEKTVTGFHYPLGKAIFRSGCGKWLGRDRDNDVNGCYEDGRYHIGVDMMADFLSPVFPVSNGEIYDINRSKDWENGNVAVIVKHKLSDSASFYAIYGHVLTPLKKGDAVTAGIPFAQVGKYSYGNHLHFGIWEPGRLPSAPFGRMPNSRWPDTNGFVNPVEFIEKYSPD